MSCSVQITAQVGCTVPVGCEVPVGCRSQVTHRVPRSARLSLLLSVSLIVCCILALAPRAALAQGAAKIVLSSPTVQFGRVVEGDSVEKEFTFSNAGSGPLVVSRLISGCGCLAVLPIQEPVAPGRSAVVKLTLDTIGLAGEVSKLVRIYSNDPTQPIVSFTLTGTVEPEVTVEPRRVLFTGMTVNQEIKPQVVTLRSRPGVTIGEVLSLSGKLKVQSQCASANECTVSVAPAKLDLGESRDRVVVRLKGGRRESVNIPVLLSVEAPVRLSPSAVSFGVIAGKELVSKDVQLENRDEGSLGVTGVKSTNPAVTATFKTQVPGKKTVITVTIDPKLLTNDLRTTLTIATTSKARPDIALDVYGILAKQP